MEEMLLHQIQSVQLSSVASFAIILGNLVTIKRAEWKEKSTAWPPAKNILMHKTSFYGQAGLDEA